MSRTPRSPRRRSWLALGAVASFGAVAVGGVTLAAQGCTQQPILEPLRSLERSGAISYVCLAAPGSSAGILRPLAECTGFAAPDPITFTEDEAGTVFAPHLYAMVTQTSRGEVAVVDLTAQTASVIDENPGIPGANFLPIGATPIDIVSTPHSTATFVGVAEIARPGIFALPSLLVRPSSLLEDGGVQPPGDPARPAPSFSSWPACALPAAPGAMLLIDDPPSPEGTVRGRCDDPYGRLPPVGANGDLGLEGTGRQKLVIAMPDLGGIAVIDAQTLLDRDPGSFDACPIDRWVPLEVELPKTTNPPPPPPGVACVQPAEIGPDYSKKYVPRPAGMSYADGKLYVADLQAPVIHVLSMPTPCDPVEGHPLLPTALTGDQTRVPVTSKVSVGPLTTDLRRFAYAVDEVDGTMMVFDVGPTSKTFSPLVRQNAQWDPLSARDRVRLASPVADIIVAQHDAEQPLPTTGVAPEGAKCDPNPTLVCLPDTSNPPCSPGAIYRSTAAFDSGAGPLKLRGQFAFAALTNGHIGVVDIEDYDAPCRIPGGTPDQALVPLAGCVPAFPAFPICRPGGPAPCLPTKPPSDQALLSANEISCNVVTPNTPRDSVYTTPDQNAGFHQPSVQTMPLLYDLNGSVVDTPNAPFMIGTVPVDPNTFPQSGVSIATTPQPLCGGTMTDTSCVDVNLGRVLDEQGQPLNTLFMNLEDPHAQAVDQNWTVTYEGVLPGFSEKLATLQFEGKPSDGLYDVDSRFCDGGVHSKKAALELLAAYHATGDLETRSLEVADYVQIAGDLPLETDPFWTGVDPRFCSFSVCNATFGNADTPTAFRDLPIAEAYQDHVELILTTHEKVPQPDDPNGNPVPPQRMPIDPKVVDCCFPPPVPFNVRVGSQWVALGSASGMLHHVIPDPTKGVCRDSCDPLLQRMNSRIYPASLSQGMFQAVVDQDFSYSSEAMMHAFINPMFRFAVVGTGARDDVFQFTTQGAFQPLLVALAPDANTLMAPVAISLVPPLGELLAVIDGGHQGITTVEIGTASVSRHFF